MSLRRDSAALFRETGQHFRTGVAYMLPVLLIYGVMGSLALLGRESDAAVWSVCGAVSELGKIYFVPVMAAYVAFSMVDTPGIVPGLIIGALAQQTGSGYLGALLGALLVGYITFVLMRVVVPEIWESTWGMFVPVASTGITAMAIVFMLGPPVAAVMDSLTGFVGSLDSDEGAVMGAVMGALGGIDYGGPFSKTQSTFATAAIDMNLFTPLGICGAIVSVPPLGMCLATVLGSRLYTTKERRYAKQSWFYALAAGFTEIVIPLAVGDLWRVTLATVAGCVTTGAIAGALALELSTPVLGITQLFFYSDLSAYFFSVAVGVIVVAVVANALKSRSGRDVAALNQRDQDA